MSRVYIILLITASLSIASMGAVFSIAGLTKLFAGAAYSVILMASALEFAKLVTAGYLYRYWGHINTLMKIYLSCAVVALSCITSLGIFGYLSNAYQKSSKNLKFEDMKVATLKDENNRIQEEIKRLQTLIANVPKNRITKRLQLQDQFEPRIRQMERRSEVIFKEINDTKVEKTTTETDLGPLVYVAETFNATPDSVARFLIFLFVSIFDPLAICLVFATNLAIRLREKYRGNENRIASLSFVQPVDHRFKKNKKAS